MKYPDLIDQAQDRAEHELNLMIDNRKIYNGESAFYCFECLEPIPQARRDAIRGCNYCVECQQLIENKK